MTLQASRCFLCLAAVGLAASATVSTTRSDPAALGPLALALAAPTETVVNAVAPARIEASAAPASPVPSPGLEDLELALDEADAGLRDRILAERLPVFTLLDPWRAARFAELLPDARLRELALLQVAMSWARSDPGGAVHWAESLADAQMRDAAITDISLALAETDPARAVALRERFAAGATPADNTLVNLVHQWAERDFEAALAWAQAQPPGTLHDQVLQRLVFVRAANGDLAAAAELARSSIMAPRIRAVALAAVAQQEG
jgi:hypothetical protein